MAASPRWKVYVAGEYAGSLKDEIHALMLCASLGEGEIRDGHRIKDIVWNQRAENYRHRDSYDLARDLIAFRVADNAAR